MSEKTLPMINTLFQKDEFQLPKRWDGVDFKNTLESFFDEYQATLRAAPEEVKESFSLDRIIPDIERACSSIIKSVDCYLDGFPSKAYTEFEDVMDIIECAVKPRLLRLGI